MKTNPLNRALLGLIVGVISGSIGAAIIASLKGDTIPILGGSLSNVLFWGVVYGASSGLVTSILSGIADYRSGTGLEWAIVGAFAALALILVSGQRSTVIETIQSMSLLAIPSAIAGWFIARRLPDTTQRTHVTFRTLTIYALGIALMPITLFCSVTVLAILLGVD